jgi:hypothetical protein
LLSECFSASINSGIDSGQDGVIEAMATAAEIRT